MDKPFTVRSAEGEELMALADRLGRVLTVFQNRRWDGDFLHRAGPAGGGAWAGSPASNRASSAGRPTVSKAWKAAATVDDGGGVLFDLGTHLMDQALQLFGPPR